VRLFYFAPPKSVHTVRWLSAFVTQGHEVHLATIDVAAAQAIPGVTVHDMNVTGATPGPIRFLQRWKKVRGILYTVRPDIVHGHIVSSPGGYAAYFGVHPLVMTAWGTDIFPVLQKSRLQLLMTRWRLAQCDLVTVDSEDLKRAVMVFGVPNDRIALVQWGVDVEHIRSFQRSDRLRQLANVPSDAFVLLSTRWFEPIYNLETVLRSIPRILAEINDQEVFFVFIGGGSLQPRLEALANSLGVQKHVRFVGQLTHKELMECYGGADAYISVPQSDSTSVSLLEALAAGLPVVVSDVASNLEWVQDSWNGYIVPRIDSGAIAKAVLLLIKDKAACQEFGLRNMEIATKRADHRINMHKMEGLYENLVKFRQESLIGAKVPRGQST
jgi:glycosyltransferase involved in cell wall biosynthesis